MIKNSVQRLAHLVEIIPPLLLSIDEKNFSYKPSAEKWSKKEIIGHLIDSAANNHQRFVRGQFQNTPTITYDQNNWNKCSYHQEIDGKQIINFWTVYNKQLLEIIKRIPQEKLENTVQTENLHSLEFLIKDYVAHLEHHLRQIVSY